MQTFNIVVSWICVLLSLFFLAITLFLMEWQLVLCGIAITVIMVLTLHKELSR